MAIKNTLIGKLVAAHFGASGRSKSLPGVSVRLVAFMLFTGIPFNNALACGTVDLAYRIYESAVRTNDPNQMDQAFSMLSNCDVYHTYEPGKSDLQILTMLDHVFSDRPPRPPSSATRHSSKIFREYNCLYPARHLPEYTRFASLGASCEFDTMQSWLVVMAPGDTHLLSEPASDSPKLEVITNNTLVSEISRQGEWVEIETRRHATVYERPVLKGWIHATMLEDYGSILSGRQVGD